jgi:hypothetical protein
MSETVLRRIWQAMERWRWRAVALAGAMLLAIAVFSWFGVTAPDRTAEQSFLNSEIARPFLLSQIEAKVLKKGISRGEFRNDHSYWA